MKQLGLIGGIGWESSVTYYRLINQEVRNRLGSLYTAPILMNSVQFQTLDTLARSGQWNEAGEMLAKAAQALERAGAEGLVLCSNLMHFVAPHIEKAVAIPLLHLGDALCDNLRGESAHIGLLGTRFTLEHNFLLNRRPHPRWGTATVYTPERKDCDRLDRIIYNELCRGIVQRESAGELLRIGAGLRAQGAKVVVLASSELGLLLPAGSNPPAWLYDGTELHANAAVRWALNEKSAGTGPRPRPA